MDHEEEDLVDEDGDDNDPGAIGPNVPIPEDVSAECGFFQRFSSRLNNMLGQENPNFQEFEALAEDLVVCMKKELNFKSSEGDGAARPSKHVSVDDAKSVQRLYRKNRKKALRIIYNDESDFCDLDPEAVANHYATDAQDQLSDLTFMKEIDISPTAMNGRQFTPSKINRKLRRCENTAPIGITYNHIKKIDHVR